MERQEERGDEWQKDKMEWILHKLGLGDAVFEAFRREKILPHHVPNLNDQQLIQLGVVAMGDRTELRRECQAVSYFIMSEIEGLIEQVCNANDRQDAESIVDEVERAIDVTDMLLQTTTGSGKLVRVRSRLTALYEHWMLSLNRLSHCTQLAVGIEGGSQTGVGVVGRPLMCVNLDLVELLRSAGYTWDEISKALMISRTWRRVKEGNLVTTIYTDISDNNLDVAVIDLQNRHPNSGQVLLQGLLQVRGISVQRHRLRDSLKRVDPLLANARRNTPISRRTYHVPGPNSLWHIDSHHSLIRWRLVIHGCIDGYSRLVLYLKCCDNNRSDTVLDLFVGATEQYGLSS